MIIQVGNICKSYGRVKALDNVTLTIDEPEIFGVVGPNGAGKTTLIEIMEGLRQPDSGFVRILGLDPNKDRAVLARSIGIQLQESALQDRIRVGEALKLYASFYRKTLDRRQLLANLGLAEHVDVAFAKLSGGQKQRLFIALALIHDPSVIFLDELTTGLDPHARRTILDMVRGIRDRGKTVFITTHYMKEAEELCGRVAIIDHGRVVKLDSPANLLKTVDLETEISFSADNGAWLEKLGDLRSVKRVAGGGGRFSVYGRCDTLLADVVGFLNVANISFTDMSVKKPNLEDVFLCLTSKDIRE